jgi:hypothetical protein
MGYEQQILRILTAVGEKGISVSALAKNIYNENCTFFSQPDFAEIKVFVQQYLLRNSKSSNSTIEHTDKRGYYRLNMNNKAFVQQMMLEFVEEEDEEQIKSNTEVKKDYSLDLFADIEE